MYVFGLLAENIKKIDLQTEFDNFVNNSIEYEDAILESQRERIRTTGKDIFGKIIRTDRAIAPNVYTEYTKNVKKSKGQRNDIVTLTDTGNFLDKELNIISDGKEHRIDYYDKKDDGYISDNVDLTDVFGWTDSDLEYLINIIIPKFIDYIQQTILTGL